MVQADMMARTKKEFNVVDQRKFKAIHRVHTSTTNNAQNSYDSS